MAQGLLNAYKANEQRDKEEEAQAKLDALNSENMRLKKLDMALKYSNTRARSFTDGNYKVASSGGKSVDTVEQSISQLKQFDIPDEVIAKISGGGARDLAKIVTAFIAAKEEHLKEYGEVNPMPNEMFVEALNNAVITQPEGYKVDIDAVLKKFGITASEAERLMFPPNVAPRQQIDLKAGSLNIVPALKPADLSKAIQAISTNVIINASEELKKYQDTIGQFPSEDSEINIWLANRIKQIETAISKGTGDIPILTDLFGLFGNSYASQYIESQPVLRNAVKMGQFPRAYAEAAERPDIDLTVPVTGIGNLSEHGAKIYNYLMQNNLVPIGTRIKFLKTNGTEYNHLVTQELLDEYNG